MSTRNEWEMRHSPVPWTPTASAAEIAASKREQELRRQIDALAQELAQARVDAARYAKLKARASKREEGGGYSGCWDICGIPAYSAYVRDKYNYLTFDGAVDALKS